MILARFPRSFSLQLVIDVQASILAFFFGWLDAFMYRNRRLSLRLLLYAKPFWCKSHSGNVRTYKRAELLLPNFLLHYTLVLLILLHFTNFCMLLYLFIYVSSCCFQVQSLHSTLSTHHIYGFAHHRPFIPHRKP